MHTYVFTAQLSSVSNYTDKCVVTELAWCEQLVHTHHQHELRLLTLNSRNTQFFNKMKCCCILVGYRCSTESQ